MRNYPRTQEIYRRNSVDDRRRHGRMISHGTTIRADLAGRCGSTSPGADRFLAELGAHLIADGVPLAGGALTLAVPHPIIARRTWLWRAENGEVIEALGFAPAGLRGQKDPLAMPAALAGRARRRGGA